MAGRAPSAVRGHPRRHLGGPTQGARQQGRDLLPSSGGHGSGQGCPQQQTHPQVASTDNGSPAPHCKDEHPKQPPNSGGKRHTARDGEKSRLTSDQHFRPARKKSCVLDPPSPTRERKGRVHMGRKSQVGQRATWEARTHKMYKLNACVLSEGWMSALQNNLEISK